MRRLFPLFVLMALLVAACGSTSPTDSAASTDSTAPDGQVGGDPTDPVAPDGPVEPIEVIAPTDTARALPDPDAPIDELGDSFNALGFDLLRSQSVDENSVLSPISIGHAVLMARAAADDSTGAAIDDSLLLPDRFSAHEAWNSIDRSIAETSGAETGVNGQPTPIVQIADRIWPAESTSPSQEWVDLLAQYHGADVSTIDVGQPEASRSQINQWVSDNTEGLIPSLLPSGFITESTQLVLTDTVYFEAEWATVFGKYGDTVGDFTLLDGSTESVTFMRDLEGRGARGTGDGWTAAVLPYRGDTYSMTVIVPDEGRFEEIRNGLNSDLIESIDSTIEPGPYELLLPRWENTSSLDLLPWLTEIGAAPGNYPGIGEGVFLSGGVHAADIAVDENGTVAAAATALGFDESGPPDPEIIVAADKPFLYLIRHDETGAVLFVGQVTNPNG